MDSIDISNTKRFCFVVTLFGGDNYLPGALVVANAFHRLGDVNSADLVCLVTDDVSYETKKLLSISYHYVISVDYLSFDKAVNPLIIKSKPHYTKVWTKFHALRLTTYEKICLIDADYLPYHSMLSVFDYETPAAVTETPTGISVNDFDFSKDQSYSTEWADLFGNCCSTGKNIPGIIFLMLLYSNNLDLETGYYSSNPKLTGNFYYGGMNASVMLLEPNIFEFRAIIADLENYDDTKRLTFFYPEQQYLTLRYSFGKNLTANRIPEINKEFLDFIDRYFNIFYAKIASFKNILSNNTLSFCDKDSSCLGRSDDKLLQTADLVQIITNVLGYYINYDNENKKIGPWTSLGIEYFITEYYDKLPSKERWIGFPILQQQKLWTTQGVDLIKENRASLGYIEWFEEFTNLLNKLILLYNDNPNQYQLDKINEWNEIINYYRLVHLNI